MAKTPQAKASQAGSATVKRRKSSGGAGADAAQDKQIKDDQQESKHEEKKHKKKEEKAEDKQDNDNQAADKAVERDDAGDDSKNKDKTAKKSSSEAKQPPKSGKTAAKKDRESAQDKKQLPSKDDDIAKPSEQGEETQDSRSEPASNTTKKRTAAASAKSDTENTSSGKDDGSKAPPSKKPKKEQRQGARQSSRSTNTTTTATTANKGNNADAGDTSSSRRKPNKAQLLQYLISAEAEHLCRPDDESEALSASPLSKTTKTYGGPEPLSPFEELISAMILSRPISHRLGLRTIRTVLNEPYWFSSAKRVQDAGDDKRRQALLDARTQHKDKTASQLGLAGDVVLEKYCRAANADSKGDKKAKGGAKGGRKSAGGASAADDGDAEGRTLAGLVAQSDSDIDDLLATLQSDIKGFGKTTAAIFRRRMQWAWEFAYPYVDERTADGLKDLGLPIRAEPLVELVEEHWEGSLKGADLAGDDEETRKRRAFTAILERATNARLEGKVGDVLAAAANS